jgi:hypothetical protein
MLAGILPGDAFGGAIFQGLFNALFRVLRKV